jgi:hypothetical protein
MPGTDSLSLVHLITEVNLFAYPRCGSHFFLYCMAGLYDIVTSNDPRLSPAEVIDRATELNPDVLYALTLREPGVALHPVHFNANNNGMHGLPTESERLTIVLIRDPVATVYSLFRFWRDRLGLVTDLTTEWLASQFLSYADFYDRALEVLARQKERGLLVRWEQLVAGPQALESITEFTGIAPKLRPSFVWSMTQFENFVRPGERTFYRSGTNAAWSADPLWGEILSRVGEFSFERFGYGSIARDAETVRTCM